MNMHKSLLALVACGCVMVSGSLWAMSIADEAAQAVFDGSWATVRAHADQRPADINSPGTDGRTALMVAVAYDPTTAQYLIDNGADVNVVAGGKTALNYAINTGLDAVRFLLERGATVSAELLAEAHQMRKEAKADRNYGMSVRTVDQIIALLEGR